MVVYQWQCLDCGEPVDVERHMSDSGIPPDHRCPMCAGDKWEKLITGGLGFQLKGQGWEKDGYELKSDTQAFEKRRK